MKINDDYSLEIDQIGTYILKYHYISKVDKPSSKDIGYYPNIQQALKGCLNHSIIETDLVDVKTVSDKLDKMYVDINKYLKRAKRENKLILEVKRDE